MIQDGIPINTLERAVATDVTKAEELLARQITEAVRILSIQNYKGTTGNQLQRPHVASGLQFRLSGAQLELLPGLLAQQVTPAPPDVPTPAALDSSYRFGLSLATVNISDPWDTTSAWWLLEGRVVQVATLNENRDVFNPALGTFAVGGPFDKQYENQIETQWVKGTATTIPAHTADWAPLGAVYRPAGGGAISGNDVVMLSVQFEDIDWAYSSTSVARRDSFRFRNNNAGVGPDIEMSLAGAINGLKAYARTDSTLTQLRHADFIDPGDIGSIAVANIWWYVYLVPVIDDKCPQGLYGLTRCDHRGVLVCSRVAPNDFGSNSAAIDLPDPIGGTISAEEGIFLAVWRASGAGANIHHIDIADSGEGKVNEWEFLNDAFPMNQGNTYQTGAHNLATTGAAGLEDVPFGVHLKCFAETVVLDITAVGFAASVTWAMVGCETVTTLLGWRDIARSEFELTPKDGALTVTVAATAVSAALGGLAWNAANVANNAHRAGLWGIRF